MPEEEVLVREVQAKRTQSGNTRYVLVDDSGREFTTFKEPIAKSALAVEGRRARIAWHEQERNGFTNVYLDKVEPLPDAEADADGAGDPVDEVAWNATIEAAPWLLGTSAPKAPVPPDELFEKLQPFKELVAEDIREDDESES